MKVRLVLVLESGRCHGSMTLKISDSYQVLKELSNLPQGIIEILLEIDWPNVLSIDVSGKNKDKDTVIDDQGNIVENKFVRLVGLEINGINLLERSLYDICTWMPLNQVSSTPEVFWDDNGKAQLKFNEINPLRFMINLDNVLYFQ